jgi:hypothetical protein
LSFQFFHVECYSRSAPASKAGGATPNINNILAEANRLVGSCPHVVAPETPTLIFGSSLDEVETLASQWASHAKDAKGRVLRKDGLVMLSGVISAPDSMNLEKWGRMREDCVSYLKTRFGERLKSVIEHTDEPPHHHIHFYCVPNRGERFEVLHAGRQASADSKKNGDLKGAQNTEYKRAMRLWQDDFFKKVAMLHGLARIGPGRRRLTRSQWQAEQLVVKTTAECLHEQIFAQSVVDSIEARADRVLLIEKNLRQDKKSLAASKIQLQSEQQKWQKLGFRFGSFFAAVIVGAAKLLQRARTLIDESAIDEIRNELVRVKRSAKQEVESVKIQAAVQVQREISQALRDERVEFTLLKNDLLHMREVESKRIEKEADLQRNSGLLASHRSPKIGQ